MDCDLPKVKFDKNFHSHYSRVDPTYAKDIDLERGFTQEEYETCLKVEISHM